jgi:hypothetical protein
VQVDAEGEGAVRVAGRAAGQHVSQVAGGTRQALQPRLVFKDVDELGLRHATVFRQPQQQARVMASSSSVARIPASARGLCSGARWLIDSR